METKEQLITEERFESLREMMKGEDPGSHTVALTILDTVDYEESEIFILCLLKECLEAMFSTNGNTKLQEDYPELHKRVLNSLQSSNKEDEVSKISFENILRAAKRRPDKKDLEFALSRLSHEFKDLLTAYGFSLLDFVDVHLTLKPE